MLEIVAIVLLWQKLRRKARERGRADSYAWLALLWVAGEILFGFFAAIGGLNDPFAMFPIILIGAAGGALLAWWIVSTLAPPPGWFPGIRWAAWCKRCNSNVWVTPAWTCEHGHPESALTGLYMPDGQLPPAPAQPQPVREQTWG